METIRLAQGGDAAAFEHIYRSHSQRVHGLCFRMTGNPNLAEDFVQDIFRQVFRKIQTFRAEPAFSTWLYGSVPIPVENLKAYSPEKA